MHKAIQAGLLGSTMLFTMPMVQAKDVPMDFVFSSGAVCGGDFANASATIDIDQEDGSTDIEISIKDAMPNAIYTVWLRLKDPSPITGGKSTALAPTSAVAGLPASEGSGFAEVAAGAVANGFVTDSGGDGKISMTIDSPIIKGSYRFEEVDASYNPVLTDNPASKFTIRVASHCTDGITHGLSAGTNEKWFNWFF